VEYNIHYTLFNVLRLNYI